MNPKSPKALLPTLFVIAGPNGAGKSTYGKQLVLSLDPKANYFDGDKEKARLRLKNQSVLLGDLDELIGISYQKVKDNSIENGSSFAYETNFSRKWLTADLAEMQFFKMNGYQTVLIFYDTATLDSTSNRVLLRVSEGGHNVDRLTQQTNFERSAENFQKAYQQFDEAYLFVNSWENNSKPPILIANWRNQKLSVEHDLISFEISERFSQLF